MIWHALATYKAAGSLHTALVLQLDDGQHLYDLVDAYRATHPKKTVPEWISGGTAVALGQWPRAAADLAAIAEQVADPAVSNKVKAIAGGVDQLVEPLRPPRIFGAASNYVEHANEMGTILAKKSESKPFIFIKASTAVIGPGQTVLIPPETTKLDWEVELGAVIGRTARRVGIDEALDCIAGYTVVNDVSARDLNKRDDFPFKFDWFQGKSFDTFAPLGPWLVPASLVGNPQSLKLGLDVNGKTMQDSTTAEMIFTVSEQVSYLSTLLTLQPGDVIATGTPTGVGAASGTFLKPGDTMRAFVEKIGVLENPVAAEVV